MKPILPSLKERKRYILFHVISNTRVSEKDISKCVFQACLQFLGELGMAKAGIQFLPETWDIDKQTGVIRAGHKFVDHAKAALALIKDISGEKAIIRCLKVSGTIINVK